MSNRISLPPGCAGFTTAEGGTIGAKPGTHTELTDNQMARLKRSANATSGMITVNPGTQIGTKLGRWCATCKRLWQAWSILCPKCNAPTLPD